MMHGADRDRDFANGYCQTIMVGVSVAILCAFSGNLTTTNRPALFTFRRFDV